MTLADRVSAFFLAALAATLVISSGLTYVAIRRQLERSYYGQLDDTLNPLVAAIEIEPGGVKWQPTEHILALGVLEGPDAVRWVVADGRGTIVDQSHNLAPHRSGADQELLNFIEWSMSDRSSQPLRDAVLPDRRLWRIMQKRVVAPPASESDDEDDDEPRESDEFDELTVTVAMSPAGIASDLRWVGWIAILLPLATWVLAAAAGRWFVRRALAPVSAMAATARSMTGDAIDERLLVNSHRDELADLGDAFNELLDRRQRSFEEQRRFTGDAAHQLRTPLTVLSGHIDVALRRPRDADEYRRTLGVLHDEVGQLRSIVDSLLFLARADGEAAAPDRQPVALDRWLPEFLAPWNDHPRRRDISLELKAPPVVAASPPLLGQLLDNLVGNACKYSEPGTPIVITAERREGAAAISVADRGPGIAAADQVAIFEPFIRTADARNRGVAGTGLGLAIAARIARALGGRITLASEPGQGSTFTVWLPE